MEIQKYGKTTVYNLDLNVNETKEIIVDFEEKEISSPLSPLLIDGRTVEIVHYFKLLGSTFFYYFKWELNIDTIVKKEQQMLYFLRILRSFGLTT